jgi:hypothetical protein
MPPGATHTDARRAIRRFNIGLDATDYEQLRHEAYLRHTSLAELCRQAVAAWLKQERRS